MLILIEGPRGAGKSHLVDNYFAQNKNENIIYFKWGFTGWVKTLGLEEDNKTMHYFSLGNILTVLEIGATLFKDKHLILDRSLFSTYVWALYRKRLLKLELINELNHILESPLYKKCHVLYINKDDNAKIKRRGEKDMFDKFENYSMERSCYDEVFRIFHKSLISDTNNLTHFTNHFDKLSQIEFNNLINSLVDK